MNVAYLCPACQASVRADFSADSIQLSCPQCAQRVKIPEKSVEGERINRCLVCPSTDLFARKDFPQRVGVALVGLGFVGSCIAWANYQVFWTFAILFLMALIDFILYLVMGESLTCYRCQAQYRGTDEIERHGGFDLETHERYRQMVARMKDRTATTVAT
jgi:hypothetical protein